MNLTRLDFLIAAASAVVATLFHAFYFNHGVHNLMDLGVLTVDSARIMDGQIYGLDFQAPYGPARYYLIAGVFALFGKSLCTLNGLFLAVMAINDALIYLSARHLMSRRFALFATLLGAVAHGSIHKSFFIFSGLLILLFLFRMLRDRDLKGAFTLGAAAGLAGLLRWDVGVIGLVAAGMTLAAGGLLGNFSFRRTALPALGRIATGALLILLPVAMWLMIRSDPLQVLHHISNRISGVDHVLTDFESWPALFTSPETRARLFALIAAILILSIVLCLVLALIRARGSRAGSTVLPLLALAFMGIPLLNQVHIQIRFNRLLHSAPLLFIAFAYLLQECAFFLAAHRVLRGLRFLPGLLAAGFLSLLTIYLYQYTGLASQDSFAALRYEERFVSHPRIRCHMRKGLAKDLEETLALIEDHLKPNDTLFADPSCTLFYFLADRPNPTPYSDWLFYYFQRSGEKKMIEALMRPEVTHCIRWPGRPVAKSPFGTACPDLARTLDREFKTVRKGRRFVMMERRRTGQGTSR